MSVPPSDSPLAEVIAYLEALLRFLIHSPAGIGYRALLGEAQHDAAVAALLASKDVLGDSARAVIARSLDPETLAVTHEQASAALVGPVFFQVLSGRDAESIDAALLARRFLVAVGVP